MIEVLAVLLIFMILLGMALVPASRWHRQQRIRSGIAVVKSTLSLARDYAMTRHENVSVAFFNQTDSRGILRSYFWISGPSGDMGFTNTIPGGVCFFTDIFQSTNGIEHVRDFHGSDPVVFIAGDPHTTGDWVVFFTNGSREVTFDANGRIISLSHIGIAESDPPGNGPALTGMVTITTNTGFMTTAPTLP